MITNINTMGEASIPLGQSMKRWWPTKGDCLKEVSPRSLCTPVSTISEPHLGMIPLHMRAQNAASMTAKAANRVPWMNLSSLLATKSSSLQRVDVDALPGSNLVSTLYQVRRSSSLATVGCTLAKLAISLPWLRNQESQSWDNQSYKG